MELEGQVALVTGAAQGIGEAIALALASAGADVVINDVNEERAKATAVRVRELGRRALPWVADVSRGDAVAAMMGPPSGTSVTSTSSSTTPASASG